MPFILLLCFISIVFACPMFAQDNMTLLQALQTAKDNSPLLKTEKYNIAISNSEIISAKIRPNPTLNNQSLQLMKPTSFPEATSWYNANNRQVWWQLTKVIQLPSQRKYKIEVAEKKMNLAEKSYAEMERNLFLEVANKWLEIWTSQKQLEIIDIAKKNIDTLVLINQVKFKNEVITQTDLFRIELLAKQYAIEEKIMMQDAFNKQTELQFLLGVQNNINIAKNDDFSLLMPPNLDSLLREFVHHRTDIQADKAAIELAESNIHLQNALAYPQPQGGFIWNPQNKVPYLGIFATIDLPFFNRNQGERQKAVLLKQKAEQQLLSTQNKFQTEILTAYSSYQLHKENVENFKAILTQSQAILDNIRYAYLRGGTTIVDFLEAQRSWIETQQKYYEITQKYRQSSIQLLFASGLIHGLGN